MSTESEAQPQFARGSALSIFSSDRMEDFIALVFALIIAFAVYFLV